MGLPLLTVAVDGDGRGAAAADEEEVLEEAAAAVEKTKVAVSPAINSSSGAGRIIGWRRRWCR